MKARRNQLIMLAMLGLLSAPAVFGSAEQIYAEELLMEDGDSEDAPMPETAAQTEGKDKGKEKDDFAGLIEDEGGNSGAGLPDGLSIAQTLAEEQEPTPMVTVDPSKYPAANFSENAREVYWYCRLELGLNHAAACGVLGNVQLESNFRPLAIGDSGTSYGVCQWHLGRLTNLMAFCNSRGLDYNTLEGQLAYLKHEFLGGYSGCYAQLLGVPDTPAGAHYAGWIMCVAFELPDQMDARGHQRGNLAQKNYYPIDFAKTATFRMKADTAVYDKAEAKKAEKPTADETKDSQFEAEDELIESSNAMVVKNNQQLAENALVKLQALEGSWAKISYRKNGQRYSGYVRTSNLEHVHETDSLHTGEKKVETEKETEKETEEVTEEMTEEITE